jgi:hypothetical protein
VSDAYRYVDGKDGSLLFQDDSDPDHRVDLSAKEPQRVARMRKGIKDWLQVTGLSTLQQLADWCGAGEAGEQVGVATVFDVDCRVRSAGRGAIGQDWG